MIELRSQAVAGLAPPDLGEATIRVTWPSVAAVPPAAAVGRLLMRTIVGAPLAWLLLAPLYFKKILPFLATRYTLTNRRLMIQRGLKPAAVSEVALGEIDEVRLKKDANSEFFNSATLEVLAKGQVRLCLPGVRDPESFRQAILNACMAWVPGKASGWMNFIPAKAEK